MVQLNNENFFNFTEKLTKYVLQCIENLNSCFDADEVFNILSLLTSSDISKSQEKQWVESMTVFRNTLNSYLNMDGIVTDNSIYDKEHSFIINICTQYLEDKI